jgi:4'-phosphopantetheinyl transferase
MADGRTYQTVATSRKSKGMPLSIVPSGCFRSPTRRDFALAQNEIHVWLAGLDPAGTSWDSFADCLSLAERERAARFKFLPDRRRYLIAHAALRSILGMYLSVQPVVLAFDSGPAGKPKLAQDFAGSQIEFNLSHSGELALIAVTHGSEVGVDIERIQENFDFASIAQRVFTSREVAALHVLPLDLQREAFYKCWTSKEALLKAKGTGLSGSLDEVQIVLTPKARVRVTPAAGGWSLTDLSPIDGYAAALATPTLDCRRQCYLWEPSFLESKHYP